MYSDFLIGLRLQYACVMQSVNPNLMQGMHRMADDNAKVRTSIFIDKALVDRLKAQGDKNRRGWTVELVVLAEEALARREKASA